MRKHSTILSNPLFQNLQEQLMFLPEASHASHFLNRANEEAIKMTATSGRKTIEQLTRFGHVGMLAKTFTELLIGTKGWYSRKCNLVWKLRGIKSGRIYCQLVASERIIGDTEPYLLPTLTAMDATAATATMKSTQVKEGSMHSVTLIRHLLATLTSRDWKGQSGHKNQKDLNRDLKLATGQTGLLNPRFAMEMMGFPTSWTELPFLNGGKNQLKEEETQ